MRISDWSSDVCSSDLPSMASRWLDVGIGVGAVAALVAAGLWLLNPLFRLLARAKAREVMTAAALLVVLGSALLMQWGGLSMAMGAFLAGVLLSDRSEEHTSALQALMRLSYAGLWLKKQTQSSQHKAAH